MKEHDVLYINQKNSVKIRLMFCLGAVVDLRLAYYTIYIYDYFYTLLYIHCHHHTQSSESFASAAASSSLSSPALL